MAAKKNARTKAALCVGINNYPGMDSDLDGCVNDAADWKAELVRRGYTVTTLLDAAATKAAMVERLTRLCRTPNADLVFTYSGHGSWIPDENGDEADARDEMLCPYDIDSGAMLLDDELATIFATKDPDSRILFISDSCHSGSVARFAHVPAAVAALHPKPRFLPPAKFLPSRSLRKLRDFEAPARASKQKFPVLLLAGCKDVEYSYDATFNNRPNGALTYFALQTLKTGPQTASEWLAKIRRHLPSPLHPQSPRLYGSAAAKNGPIF